LNETVEVACVRYALNLVKRDHCECRQKEYADEEEPKRLLLVFEGELHKGALAYTIVGLLFIKFDGFH
jgi:hypothetical protein